MLTRLRRRPPPPASVRFRSPFHMVDPFHDTER